MHGPCAWLLLCVCAALGSFLCASGLLRLNEVLVSTAPLPTQDAGRLYASVASQGPAPTRAFDRLVVVLIDALRADMVLGSDAMYGSIAEQHQQHQHVKAELNAHMPYTRALVDSQHAMGYVGYASVPTVTMPRLKALLTGKSPAFIDILKNFNSAALENENLMQFFAQDGFRLVFYGDDTWLKLFPSETKVFQRADGTSGFFTRDTVEVDTNVTRHLAQELDPTMQHERSSDWDVLVLHYLGLDHVGHLRGPRSSLMQHKLHEMDQTVQFIHESVQKQDAVRMAQNASARPSLILLCSDHGMSEGGNHGGATVEESSALMMFLSGAGRDFVHAQPERSTQGKKRLQVDLVPTLASLFQLRIPTYSTGVLVDEVVQAFQSKTPNSYVTALLANLQQLYALTTVRFHASSLKEFDQEFGAVMEEARDFVQQQQQLELKLEGRMVQELQRACRELQNKVTQSDGSEYDGNKVFGGLALLLVCVLLALHQLWLTTPSSATKKAQPNRSWNLAVIVLCAGAGLHMVSLSSSSSIENEHATCFFLLTSALCGLAIELLRWLLQPTAAAAERSEGKRALLLVISLLVVTRILRSRNQVINFGRLNGIQVDPQAPGAEFADDDSLSILSTAAIVSPDTLPNELHFALVWALVVWKSRHVLFQKRESSARTGRSWVTRALTLTSTGLFALAVLANALCHNTSKPEVSVWLLDADGYARVVYVIVAVQTLVVILLVGQRTAQLVVLEMALWPLLMLLQREANLSTLTLLCVQLVLLSHLVCVKSVALIQRFTTGFNLALLVSGIAQSSFFALGNSHLVTTIDISQAYRGLSSYSQSVVGTLTFLNVFAGPLVCWINMLQWIPLTRLQWIRAGGVLFTHQTLRFAVYTYVSVIISAWPWLRSSHSCVLLAALWSISCASTCSSGVSLRHG